MNKTYKKVVGAFFIGVSLFVGASAAVAAPGTWRFILRNSDDTEDVTQAVTDYATSSPRVLGGFLGGDSAVWYGLNTTQFSFESQEGINGGTNYNVSITGNGIDVMNLDGAPAAFAGKVSTSTYTSGIASLQSQINSLSTSVASSTLPADWNQTATSSPTYIKNKPSLNFDILGQATSSAAAVQAYAIQRANETGTQPASTITGLGAVATTSSYTDLLNKPTLGIAYEGTTQHTNAFPIFKSVTVGSGVAVFNLTADGTAGGTTLCPNGVIQDSVNATVNDSAASYQMSWAFTNSNKTLTVTTNKLSTANILTGVLGQAAGNGSVVKLSVWCY